MHGNGAHCTIHQQIWLQLGVIRGRVVSRPSAGLVSPAGSDTSRRVDKTRGGTDMGGGIFSGLAGQAGSGAPEMPPLTRPPVPTRRRAPESTDHVSDPIPFERPEPRGSARDVHPGGRAARGGRSRAHRPADARPPRARPRAAARQRPGDLDVQPEGWRRQDHDHHQPGRRAGGVRPQGAAGRLRPAGLAVGRPRPQPPRHGALGLQPADGPRRHPRRRRRPFRRARHGPAALQHRPLCGRGAAGARGGPRADPAAGARSGHRQLRRHPDRLPALARPAHRQRADRRPTA